MISIFISRALLPQPHRVWRPPGTVPSAGSCRPWHARVIGTFDAVRHQQIGTIEHTGNVIFCTDEVRGRMSAPCDCEEPPATARCSPQVHACASLSWHLESGGADAAKDLRQGQSACIMAVPEAYRLLRLGSTKVPARHRRQSYVPNTTCRVTTSTPERSSYCASPSQHAGTYSFATR